MGRNRCIRKITNVISLIFLLSFTHVNTSFCAETPYPPGERSLGSSGLGMLLGGSGTHSSSSGDVVLVEKEDESNDDATTPNELIAAEQCFLAIENEQPDLLEHLLMMHPYLQTNKYYGPLTFRDKALSIFLDTERRRILYILDQHVSQRPHDGTTT